MPYVNAILLLANYNYQKLCFKLPEDGGRSRCGSEGITRQNLASRLRGLLSEADMGGKAARRAYYETVQGKRVAPSEDYGDSYRLRFCIFIR